VTVVADGDVDVSPVVRSTAGDKIHIDGSPVRHGYVHFDLSGTNGATHATLRIYGRSDQAVGFDVRATGADWTESDIRWANAPAPGELLGSSGPVVANTAYTFDVPISGDGPVAFELETANTRAIALGTSEGSPAEAPTLTFTPGGGSTTSTGTTSTDVTTTNVTTTTPAPQGGPCGTQSTTPQRYSHVVWIFMENHSRASVIGSPNAPYETQLAKQCGEATNYQENGSPSLPNYIAVTSGSTQGITDDNPPSGHPLTVDNIFRQVRTAGGTAKSYAESMPANCTLTNSGSYLVRHVPATYYTGADDRVACARDVVPFSAFDPNNLPTFSFITPNGCNDAHDCPLATGDAWLAAHVPAILASPDYRSGNTLLVITYDEGSSGSSTIAFIAAAAGLTPNSSTGASFSHFALLRLTEEALGLPLLANAQTAGDLRAALGL
jgi:hypothetical protein